eukprot:gene55908-45825_t
MKDRPSSHAASWALLHTPYWRPKTKMAGTNGRTRNDAASRISGGSMRSTRRVSNGATT